MREITTHHANSINKSIKLLADEDVAVDHAPNYYQARFDPAGLADENAFTLSTIGFHHGPGHATAQGWTHEALIAILIDRLEHFQAGKFATVQNGAALQALKEARTCLEHRTAERIARGVENTHET